MLREMRLGICASTELSDMLHELGVEPRRASACIASGIDLERFAFNPTRDGREVLMVGRLVEKKGFEYGIAAFAHAPSSGVAARS